MSHQVLVHHFGAADAGLVDIEFLFVIYIDRGMTKAQLRVKGFNQTDHKLAVKYPDLGNGPRPDFPRQRPDGLPEVRVAPASYIVGLLG